jgi:hypothetical protein
MEFDFKKKLQDSFNQELLGKNFIRNKTINYILNDNCIGSQIKNVKNQLVKTKFNMLTIYLGFR